MIVSGIAIVAHLLPSLDLSSLIQSEMAVGAVQRLLLATLLGAFVGMARERKHRAAGLRTNMLLCMGCAFFTLLSIALAGDSTPNKGQVAANIVQGIGFLGAGLILHNRDRVIGLTSAAGIFAVASIGMACGAGLYWAAAIASGIVVLATEMIGLLEFRLNLKLFMKRYEARGNGHEAMLAALLRAMDQEKLPFREYSSDTILGVDRVCFEVMAVEKTHRALEALLRDSRELEQVLVFNELGDD